MSKNKKSDYDELESPDEQSTERILDTEGQSDDEYRYYNESPESDDQSGSWDEQYEPGEDPSGSWYYQPGSWPASYDMQAFGNILCVSSDFPIR